MLKYLNWMLLTMLTRTSNSPKNVFDIYDKMVKMPIISGTFVFMITAMFIYKWQFVIGLGFFVMGCIFSWKLTIMYFVEDVYPDGE